MILCSFNYRTYAVGVLAFGRAVLYILILFVFALAERKNEKIIIGKYHAAAGYKPLSNGHRVSPVTMTDEEIIARAAGLLQTTYRKYVKKQPGQRPAYYLSLKGGRAVVIMRLLYPLMGQRRQAQIDRAIACFGLPRASKRGEQANGAILNEASVLEIYRLLDQVRHISTLPPPMV
jgi:hypothetical protein